MGTCISIRVLFNILVSLGLGFVFNSETFAILFKELNFGGFPQNKAVRYTERFVYK